MRVEPGKTYRVTRPSSYFKEKYGTATPEIRIEDTDRVVFGKSWMDANGNPAAILYAMRSGAEELPLTSRGVYYGKIQGLGELIHESELGELVPANAAS